MTIDKEQQKQLTALILPINKLQLSGRVIRQLPYNDINILGEVINRMNLIDNQPSPNEYHMHNIGKGSLKEIRDAIININLPIPTQNIFIPEELQKPSTHKNEDIKSYLKDTYFPDLSNEEINRATVDNLDRIINTPSEAQPNGKMKLTVSFELSLYSDIVYNKHFIDAIASDPKIAEAAEAAFTEVLNSKLRSISPNL